MIVPLRQFRRNVKFYNNQWLLAFGMLAGCLTPPGTPADSESDYWPAWKEAPVVHTHYALGYAEAHEQAAWVAYKLTPEETAVNLAREGNFREDPLVRTGSASLNDYRGSGYDRGHLAPVGDMNFDSVAMEESFYMSNISPQKRAFNGGVWSRLERQVRTWATEKGGVYIVTGPVLGQAKRTIGENQVTVPDFFYKVLLEERGSNSRMIALVVPTTARDEDLREFAEKVDNVEAYTGIDFFPALPDDLEERLERTVDTEGWFE